MIALRLGLSIKWSFCFKIIKTLGNFLVMALSKDESEIMSLKGYLILIAIVVRWYNLFAFCLNVS